MSDIASVLDGILCWISTDWSDEGSLLRDLLLPFTVAGFAAFFGAFFAAWISLRIERDKNKLIELEKTNSAATLAAAVCSSALSLKRQYLAKMHADYATQREHIVSRLETPTTNKPIHVDFNLFTITSPSFLSEPLFQKVSELLRADAINLIQAGTVLASTNNLKLLNSDRNSWIESFKERSKDLNESEKVQEFFGLETEKRTRDEIYKNLIENLYATNDDIIFHSHELVARLVRRAFAERRKLGRKVSKGTHVNLVDFSEQRNAGLFPNDSDYSDWKKAAKISKRKWYETKSSYEEKTLANLGF